VRPYVVALALLWGVPFVLVVVLHLTLPRHNSGDQCAGIGFGCVPTPADSVLLVGLLAAPVLYVAGVVSCVVIAVRRRRRDH